MKSSISIVIPALNEEGNLDSAVQSVLEAIDGRFSSYEVIIINDGSTDRTPEIADGWAEKDPHIKVIHHPQPMGMGHSLLAGFRLAAKDCIGSFPGDNGLDKQSLADMFDIVGRSDVVLYYIANPEFRSLPRRVLSRLFTMMMNALFGLRLRYYNGHAIYKRELLQNIPHATGGHAFLAQVLVRLVKAGCSTVEIGTLQHERKHGRTKAFSLKNIASVLLGILSLAWEVNVLKKTTPRRHLPSS